MRLVGSSQNQIYDQGGSPQISGWNPRGNPHGLLRTRVPNRNPLETQGLPTSRTMYDQGGSPQAELRPGRQNYDQGPYVFFVCFQQKMMMSWNCPSNCRSEQAPRGPETRREPQRGTETHREASASAQTVSDQKVFRCLSKYYVTRRRLSSSLSSQVSICKVICFVLFCVFSVFFLCMHVCTRVCSAPPHM